MVQDEPKGEVVPSGAPREKKPNVFARIALFIRQVLAELRKVVWPTRREVLLTTGMVVFLAALAAVFFSLVDLLIRTGLTSLLSVFGS